MAASARADFEKNVDRLAEAAKRVSDEQAEDIAANLPESIKGIVVAKYAFAALYMAIAIVVHGLLKRGRRVTLKDEGTEFTVKMLGRHVELKLEPAAANIIVTGSVFPDGGGIGLPVPEELGRDMRDLEVWAKQRAFHVLETLVGGDA